MFNKSLIALTVLMSSSVIAGTSGIKIKSQQLSDSIRIVGGNETAPHSRPYQVSVQSLGGSHFCGGSIVADDLVLTAAHCLEDVDGASPKIQVRVGAHSLTDGSGQAIEVDKTYTNQEYPGLSKDVAILKLKQKITDKNARVIKLADQSFFDANIKAGTSLTVSGWGTLSSGGQMPDKLMEVKVPFVTNAVCNSPEAYNGSVQNTELCAGFKTGGKDSCQGDSGGPLVYQRGEELVQVGVVSWGDGCAMKDKYGVYGDVAKLRGWIDSAMAGNEPVSGLAGGGSNGDGDLGGDAGDNGDNGSDNTSTATGDYLAFQETVSYTVGEEALQFVLEVQEGVNVIYIATRGGEGDADITAEMITNDDSAKESNDFWGDFETNYYSSQNIGNDEVIMIEFPEAGEWTIKFSDYAAFKNVELTVFSH